MVVDQNPRVDVGGGQRGQDVALQNVELVRGSHVFAGIISGNIQRFVLDGEIVDRNACGLVGLHILDQIVGEGGVLRREQLGAG